MAMIDTVRGLLALMAQPDATFEGIAARVGRLSADSDTMRSERIEPALSGVASARLLRDRDTGQPYLLTLALDAGTGPRVAELESAFGAYERLRSHPGRNKMIIFSPPSPSGAYSVALIAELEEGGAVDNASRAASLQFRRDALPSGELQP